MTRLSTNSGSSSFSLAIRLQDGSTGAWSELVELYGPLVEAWCVKAGLTAAAREDIGQEVFLNVHRSIGTFDPERSDATFRGWLWTVTRNAVLQSLRKPQPLPRGGSTAMAALGEIADPWPEASEFEPPSEASDTTSLVSRALNQIKPHIGPQTWQAFWNTTILCQSTSEVASSLNMTPTAVRQAKSRTLRRLRQQLGDQ